MNGRSVSAIEMEYGRLEWEMDGSAVNRACEIWTVGGGKGGTGKSFVTSSIGTYLAMQGKRVVLIDGDLGGANLHSFFGIGRPQNSLTDFFERRSPLTGLLVETGITNMSLITGDLHSLDSGNVTYLQKLKFFKKIRSLDADYILIDLGAGSGYKTIDTFLTADKMILVITPEIIAIENMYHFVKNAVFRKIKMALGRYGFKYLFEETWRQRETYQIKNLKDLINHLKVASKSVQEIIDRELAELYLYLVLNQVRDGHEDKIGHSVKSVFAKYFGLPMCYMGHIGYNESIWRCINQRRAFMTAYASSKCAYEIGRLTEGLLHSGEMAISRG